MSRICPNSKKLCTSLRCEGGCYWEPSADQPAPTPRTDAALLADREGDQPFIDFARQLERESSLLMTRLKIQCADNERLERELSARTAEAERLREALTELVELKKIKRRMEANSAHPRERLRYEQGKENAWSRAEAAIDAAIAQGKV